MEKFGERDEKVHICIATSKLKRVWMSLLFSLKIFTSVCVKWAT